MFRKFFSFREKIKTTRIEPNPARPADILETNLPESLLSELDIEINFIDPPEHAGIWHVLSTQGNRIYKVDLNEVTCSCKVFSAVPRSTPITSSKRYCAHIARRSHELGFLKRICPPNEMISHYFSTKGLNGGSASDRFYLRAFLGNDVLIVSHSTSCWFEVVTRKHRTIDADICSGDFDLYGYNPDRNRWSYGHAPFNPVPIKEWIRALASEQAAVRSGSETNDREAGPHAQMVHLSEIFMIDPASGNLDAPIVSLIFEHLRAEIDIDMVKNSLLSLQSYGGVAPNKLAFQWLTHGQRLASQNHPEAASFLKRASEINPKVSRKSAVGLLSRIEPFSDVTTTESFEVERRKTFRAEQSAFNIRLIDIEQERGLFLNLPPTKFKLTGDELLQSEAPKWYNREAGHTYFGYLYADFVQANVVPGEASRIRNAKRTVLDYFSSLAILDDTVSNNTMARMFRLKGDFALDRGDTVAAVSHFKRALVYNPEVGVKKLLRSLAP